MRLEQTYLTKDPYCLMCGKYSKSETCSDNCEKKLSMLRFIIKERKEIEKTGLKRYDEHSIKKFRKIQEMLSMKTES